MAIKSFTDLQKDLNDTQGMRGNDKFVDLIDYLGICDQRLCKVTVDPTVAAQTTLFTVPSGYSAMIWGAELVGKVAITGANKISTLKIGTAANSYVELLDTGHMLEVHNPISLPPANKVLRIDRQKRQKRMISRTLVDLTVAADTTLYTVPANTNLRVDEVILEGNTTMSGGTSSKLLIGTVANSYVELLNGATGITFVAATGTSLLANNARINATTSIALPTSMSLANVTDFAAATVIKANVSGTVLTAGKIWVELWGSLDTDGPTLFSGGSVIKADISGSALVTAGSFDCRLLGRLLAGE